LSALEQLAAALRDEGGLLAEVVAQPGGAPEPQGDEYRLILEAIREGYLQHYASGRVLKPEDPDLALLAGDRLYAFGLARLAELGDLAAVTALADLISLSAQAHAEGDPARAEAAWDAAARGLSPDHEAAERRRRGA
jgi:hypothetical protein